MLLRLSDRPRQAHRAGRRSRPWSCWPPCRCCRGSCTGSSSTKWTTASPRPSARSRRSWTTILPTSRSRRASCRPTARRRTPSRDTTRRARRQLAAGVPRRLPEHRRPHLSTRRARSSPQVGCDHPPRTPRARSGELGGRRRRARPSAASSRTAASRPASTRRLPTSSASPFAAWAASSSAAAGRRGLPEELQRQARTSAGPRGARSRRTSIRLVGQTQDFPGAAVGTARRTDTTIIDVGGRSWAVQRFEPRQLQGRMGNVGMLAALDVTDIHVDRPAQPALRARRPRRGGASFDVVRVARSRAVMSDALQQREHGAQARRAARLRARRGRARRATSSRTSRAASTGWSTASRSATSCGRPSAST